MRDDDVRQPKRNWETAPRQFNRSCLLSPVRDHDDRAGNPEKCVPVVGSHR